MAARVTVDEVKSILDNTSLTDPVIQTFITGANVYVTDALNGSGLGDDMLKEIERYYAAHLIAITVERMASKEGAGGASITYTGTYGQGLKSSSYGQICLTMDTTGTLAKLDGKKSASTIAIES